MNPIESITGDRMSEKDALPFLDLKREYKQHKTEIDAALRSVFENGKFILGPHTEAFEKEFAVYHKVKFAIGVNSCTDAIFLSLKALGVGLGDEVLTVSHTAAPTIAAVIMAGAKPVYVDILPEDMTMDPVDAERKITRKTKALLPVHIYGYPCRMDSICALAERKGLLLIEDAAQACGASFNGKKTGTFGHAGCFSFYPTKNLGSYGDGGMIVTDDKKTAGKIVSLRQYGFKPDKKNPAREFVSFGVNSRLSEMQAAVLRIKLKYLDKSNQMRSRMASLYMNLMDCMPLEMPVSDKPSAHVYHLFVIRSKQRDRLKAYLHSKNIQTMIHYEYSLHKDKFYASYPQRRLCVTERVKKEILSLPLYTGITPPEIERVAGAIRGFYEKRP